MGTQLSKLTEEILKRDLNEVATWRIFDMQRKIIAQIAKEDEKIEFAEEIRKDSSESIDALFNKTIRWTG